MKRRAVDPRDAEIENLKHELSKARRDVIELSPAPDSLKELLSFETTYDQKTGEDYRAWEAEVVAAVIATAVPDPALSNRYEERAACPLCKSVGHGPHKDGFKLPTGLEYHLKGKMAAHHCRVTAAAFSDAQAQLRERSR